MKATIIIPTYNALKYTKLCIDSIRLTTSFPYEIIIVDNGSTDGTREYIENQKNIKLIKSKTNLGYAGACNLGIKESDSDYIIISNNDIFFTPYWLTHLVEASKSSENIGIVGPVTNTAAGYHVMPHNAYTGKLGLFNESRRIFLQNKGALFNVPVLIFFLTLIKRKTIDLVGLLDPDLGLGGCDDFDYSFRVILAGLRCMLSTSVFVHHFCSRTFSSNNLPYIQLSIESIIRFNKKWEGITSIGYKLNN